MEMMGTIFFKVLWKMTPYMEAMDFLKKISHASFYS